MKDKIALSQEQTAAIEQMLGLNQLQMDTINKLLNMIYHGYKSIDILVRKDGQEYRFEADWLAKMLRLTIEEQNPGE